MPAILRMSMAILLQEFTGTSWLQSCRNPASSESQRAARIGGREANEGQQLRPRSQKGIISILVGVGKDLIDCPRHANAKRANQASANIKLQGSPSHTGHQNEPHHGQRKHIQEAIKNCC